MKRVYLICGPSGTGKTTLAELINEGCNYNMARHALLETDRYFTDENGVYNFVPEKLQEYHDKCFKEFLSCLHSKEPEDEDLTITVSNTFTRRWERQPYIGACKAVGITPQIIMCFGEFQSTHKVPQHTIENQWRRLELPE